MASYTGRAWNTTLQKASKPGSLNRLEGPTRYSTPFRFFLKLLLLNGLKKSFVYPNVLSVQQDGITNNLVPAGSQPTSIAVMFTAVATTPGLLRV